MATIQFVTCQPSSANHFADYTSYLHRKGYDVILYASCQAREALKHHPIDNELISVFDRCYPLDVEKGPYIFMGAEQQDHYLLSAHWLEQAITEKKQKTKSVVFMDCGHPFAICLAKQLKKLTKIVKLVYFEGYPNHLTTTAREVFQLADRTIIASSVLIKEVKSSSLNHEERLIRNKFSLEYPCNEHMFGQDQTANWEKNLSELLAAYFPIQPIPRFQKPQSSINVQTSFSLVNEINSSSSTEFKNQSVTPLTSSTYSQTKETALKISKDEFIAAALTLVGAIFTARYF